jgi:hypothetical protein
VITGPSIGPVTATSATVSWLTDEPATSEVRYRRAGQTVDLVVSALGLGSSHQLGLTGLAAGTTYDVRVVSRDGSGNEATATTSVTTTWLPPVITSITPSQAASGSTLSATISGSRFAADALVSAGSGLTVTNRTVNAAGTQIVATLVIASDAPIGKRTITVLNPPPSGFSATGTFTVVDATVPVVTITEPANGAALPLRTVVVRGTVSETAMVTVNGVVATFPPETPLAWTATIVLPAPGLQTILATAVDPSGNRGAASIVVVVDVSPPTLTLAATPAVLWPASHKMVRVAVDVAVSDNVDLSPTVELVSVTSSEPDNGLGDGDTVGDIQDAAIGTDDRSVLLRAERAGNGPGRTYTLTYRATDRAGNSTVKSVTVTVPHNN